MKTKIIILLALSMAAVININAQSKSVAFEWDPPASEGVAVASHRLFYGSMSLATSTNRVDILKVPRTELKTIDVPSPENVTPHVEIQPGVHFAYVIAIDAGGLESDPSNDIAFVIHGPPTGLRTRKNNENP